MGFYNWTPGPRVTGGKGGGSYKKPKGNWFKRNFQELDAITLFLLAVLVFAMLVIFIDYFIR